MALNSLVFRCLFSDWNKSYLGLLIDFYYLATIAELHLEFLWSLYVLLAYTSFRLNSLGPTTGLAAGSIGSETLVVTSFV